MRTAAVSVTRRVDRRTEVVRLRRLMVGAVGADLSGLRIRPVGDTVLFTQQIASIVAEKPA